MAAVLRKCRRGQLETLKGEHLVEMLSLFKSEWKACGMNPRADYVSGIISWKRRLWGPQESGGKSSRVSSVRSDRLGFSTFMSRPACRLMAFSSQVRMVRPLAKCRSG